jgi:hypothetical protein
LRACPRPRSRSWEMTVQGSPMLHREKMGEKIWLSGRIEYVIGGRDFHNRR